MTPGEKAAPQSPSRNAPPCPASNRSIVRGGLPWAPPFSPGSTGRDAAPRRAPKEPPVISPPPHPLPARVPVSTHRCPEASRRRRMAALGTCCPEGGAARCHATLPAGPPVPAPILPTALPTALGSRRTPATAAPSRTAATRPAPRRDRGDSPCHTSSPGLRRDLPALPASHPGCLPLPACCRGTLSGHPPGSPSLLAAGRSSKPALIYCLGTASFKTTQSCCCRSRSRGICQVTGTRCHSRGVPATLPAERRVVPNWVRGQWVGVSISGAVFKRRTGRFGQRGRWAAQRLSWFHWGAHGVWQQLSGARAVP